ncbi:hypothetical protein D3C85_930770 [compost metagenome]
MSDFEAASFAQQDVFVRHPDVFKQHFGVTMRRIVVTEHRQRTHNLHAGGIDRHQNHRVLGVAWRVRIAQPHENQDFAAWVASTRGPPFLAVDHPLITIAHRTGGHVGGIGGRHVRFGHGECRANLAAQQGFEPALLLFFVGITHQHFHVAGVRCRAVERLWPQQRAAHDFRQRRVFEVGQPGTQFGLRQKQIPQAFGLGLEFQFFHDRRRLPAIALGDLALEHGFGGIDVGVHERCYALTQFLNLGRISEIHERDTFLGEVV